MVWWESAAAPNRDGEITRRVPCTWDRQKPKLLKFNEVLGSGCALHVGLVRLAQPLGFVRLGGGSNSPTARSDGPGRNGRWEFYPISDEMTNAI